LGSYRSTCVLTAECEGEWAGARRSALLQAGSTADGVSGKASGRGQQKRVQGKQSRADRGCEKMRYRQLRSVEDARMGGAEDALPPCRPELCCLISRALPAGTPLECIRCSRACTYRCSPPNPSLAMMIIIMIIIILGAVLCAVMVVFLHHKRHMRCGGAARATANFTSSWAHTNAMNRTCHARVPRRVASSICGSAPNFQGQAHDPDQDTTMDCSPRPSWRSASPFAWPTCTR
jgi:hypothetical protein